MPFRSQAQRRYLYARHPAIAKRWRRESGPQRGLPQRAKSRRDRMISHFIDRRR